jgi:hypothetical protein
MHHDTTSGLMQAVDEYLKSKTNLVVSLGVAGAQVAAPLAVENPFDWVFLFQSIGAVYISMQIIYMIFKFVNFLREVKKDAKWWR